MIAIVTGASSGLGACFCKAIDGRGFEELWIVARRAGRLEGLSDSLDTPCRIVTADLSTDDGIDAVTGMVSEESPDVGLLVNCAGVGRFGTTEGLSSDETRAMISVNVTALTEITRACIPCMRPGSAIVQVCSASAYLPLEGLNVYSATKAYVRSFTEALRGELGPRGISVMEVSPGWVRTGFIDASREGASVPDGVFRHSVTAEEVVMQAMRDLDAGRGRSVCGAYDGLQIWVCRHLPSLATKI